jgi:hypothetical protein
MKTKISDTNFIEAVKKAKSISDALKIMGLSKNNQKSFKNRVKKLCLDTSHLSNNRLKPSNNNDLIELEIRKILTKEDILYAVNNTQSFNATLILLFGAASKSEKWLKTRVKRINPDTTHL